MNKIQSKYLELGGDSSFLGKFTSSGPLVLLENGPKIGDVNFYKHGVIIFSDLTKNIEILKYDEDKKVYRYNSETKTFEILGTLTGAAIVGCAGVIIGGGCGIAMGPLGAIAGTIPGGILGIIIGGLIGNRLGLELDRTLSKIPIKPEEINKITEAIEYFKW